MIKYFTPSMKWVYNIPTLFELETHIADDITHPLGHGLPNFMEESSTTTQTYKSYGTTRTHLQLPRITTHFSVKRRGKMLQETTHV